MTFRSAIVTLLLLAGFPAGAQAPFRAELAPNVTIEVTDLRRLPDKDAVQLKFAVTNAGSSLTSARKLGLAGSVRLENIVLIDFANKRSYTVGSGSRCLCTTFEDGGEIQPGARREFWAWFGLPPAGVQALSVQVADQPPITDVPLR